MTILTHEQVDAIAERAEKATWEIWTPDTEPRDYVQLINEFNKHSRADVLALVAAVRELRTGLECCRACAVCGSKLCEVLKLVEEAQQ